MPPLGECMCRITLAAAIANDFDVKHKTLTITKKLLLAE
jgi:hypothetical protein